MHVWNGSNCEGFRTTADRDDFGLHRGRRPKASNEGTRVRLSMMAAARWGAARIVETPG